MKLRITILLIIGTIVVLLGMSIVNANEGGDVSDVVYEKIFNRKPGSFPLLPSFTIESYKELYQHPEIPNDIPKEYHKYFEDNNLYENEVYLADNEIIIKKLIRYSPKYGHVLRCDISDKYHPLCPFVKTLKTKINGNPKEYKPFEKKPVFDGLYMCKYDMTELRNMQTKEASNLVQKGSKIIFWELKDSKDRVIWEHAAESEMMKESEHMLGITDDNFILDAKKIAEDKYMVLLKYEIFSNVLFVDLSASKRVTEAYTVYHSVFLINAGEILYPDKGEILSDNVVRLEYNDGHIRDYMVKLTTKDAILNLTKCGEMANSLIWQNSKPQSSLKEDKAWNFKQGAVKPIYL